MKSAGATKKKPVSRPSKRQGSQGDAVGTLAEGIGIVQLRVGLSQLIQEGHTILLSNESSGLCIVIPDMVVSTGDASPKRRITYKASGDASPEAKPVTTPEGVKA